MSANRRAALCGWGIAAGVYLLAVLDRTSLGVGGLLAERRFGISPSELGVFIFVQLGVYAVMQVPTGILVDRYGPKRLLITASLVLGGAQLLFTVLPWYPAALLTRAVLGCGDALTFVSVLRFAAAHFGPRRYPVLVALTGTAGAAGNVLATLPLTLVLHRLGWAFGFGITAAASLLAAVAVYVTLPAGGPRRARARGAVPLRASIAAVRHRVGGIWAQPGTKLGFWVLFACMSVNTSFGVLWGNSYLIKAAGFSAAGAGSVLMYAVLAMAVSNPIVGMLIARYPAARVSMVIGACVVTMGGWVVAVTVFGSRPPQAYVLGLFIAMGVLSQASLAGFALARDYNGARLLGTATGVVNVGGFMATILITVGIGAALGALGGGNATSFRLAVLVAVLVQGYGTMRVVAWLRQLRSLTLIRLSAGEKTPVRVVRHRWDLPVPVSSAPIPAPVETTTAVPHTLVMDRCPPVVREPSTCVAAHRAARAHAGRVGRGGRAHGRGHGTNGGPRPVSLDGRRHRDAA